VVSSDLHLFRCAEEITLTSNLISGGEFESRSRGRRLGAPARYSSSRPLARSKSSVLPFSLSGLTAKRSSIWGYRAGFSTRIRGIRDTEALVSLCGGGSSVLVLARIGAEQRCCEVGRSGDAR
jgi:hypothetical protein